MGMWSSMSVVNRWPTMATPGVDILDPRAGPQVEEQPLAVDLEVCATWPFDDLQTAKTIAGVIASLHPDYLDYARDPPMGLS